MGVLVVRRYPITQLAQAADHTYVECGTGAKGWSCWGRKTGGDYLRAAPGSTRRADAIAEANERAGITCYLINGVCHQSANRILTAAGITVDGARGYALSVSIFGVYGRPRGAVGLCEAPFNRHMSVTGDLDACIQRATTVREQSVSYNADRPDYTDAAYMAQVDRLYEARAVAAAASVDDAFAFQMEHFRLLVDHKLGRSASLQMDSTRHVRLMDAREHFERQRLKAEEALSSSRNGRAFVEEFDRLTLQFQADVAEVLEPQVYQTLLNLPPDHRIVLSDPAIVDAIYEGTDFTGGSA